MHGGEPHEQNSSISEREREFYLTPVAPGCGHMAAGAAEVASMSLYLQGGSTCRPELEY